MTRSGFDLSAPSDSEGIYPGEINKVAEMASFVWPTFSGVSGAIVAGVCLRLCSIALNDQFDPCGISLSLGQLR